MSSTYVIIFNDFTLNHIGPGLIPVVTKFREASNLKRARLTDYPLTSINKCIWSPNIETRNTLANLIHSGFIRISSIAKELTANVNFNTTPTPTTTTTATTLTTEPKSKSPKKKDEKIVKPRVSSRRKRSLPP